MGIDMSMEDPILYEADRCMKCGFCMSVCPVYEVDRNESHVARGRNTLISWAEKGKIVADRSYRDALSFCILCHRCENVCPAGVPTSDITLKAREKDVRTHGLSLMQRLAYHGILKHRHFIASMVAKVASLIPRTKTGAWPLRHLAEIYTLVSKDMYLPSMSTPFLHRRLPTRTSPPKGVKVKGEVALFPGCMFEFFFADIGLRLARILSRAGYEVVFPQGLSCCGVAVHNAGDKETAMAMAIKNIKILKGFDFVVSGCATCASTLKDYPEWFPYDHEIRKDAEQVSAASFEFSQFIWNMGIELKSDVQEDMSVTYHDPCHLKWHMGIKEEPRLLLKNLKDIRYIEMEGADRCCGLGGTFGIDHRKEGLAIQKKKMDYIRHSGAKTVVTTCPGCMVQLLDGARRYGMEVDVKHVSELIA